MPRERSSGKAERGGAEQRKETNIPLATPNQPHATTHTRPPSPPAPKHNHRTNCKCENFPCSQLKKEKVTFSWPWPCMANGRAGLQK